MPNVCAEAISAQTISPLRSQQQPSAALHRLELSIRSFDKTLELSSVLPKSIFGFFISIKEIRVAGEAGAEVAASEKEL